MQMEIFRSVIAWPDLQRYGEKHVLSNGSNPCQLSSLCSQSSGVLGFLTETVRILWPGQIMDFTKRRVANMACSLDGRTFLQLPTLGCNTCKAEAPAAPQLVPKAAAKHLGKSWSAGAPVALQEEAWHGGLFLQWQSNIWDAWPLLTRSQTN